MALLKSFKLHENLRFDFSVNSTNILNHPSFGTPDRLVGAGHVGKITSVAAGCRQIEFVGKFKF